MSRSTEREDTKGEEDRKVPGAKLDTVSLHAVEGGDPYLIQLFRCSGCPPFHRSTPPSPSRLAFHLRCSLSLFALKFLTDFLPAWVG